jgi:hypothetical protein
MSVQPGTSGGDVAKKAQDSTLGDIAEGLGTMLGKAERQWKAWQGPRDNMIKAVTEVRDRAIALLSEMGATANAARAAAAEDGGKKKKGKKAKKADKAEKAGKKADKKSDKKAGKKKSKKAGQAADAAPADVAP